VGSLVGARVGGRQGLGGAAAHEAHDPMIAFVFSGGGSLGAVQVGMLQALVEAGIRPDLCVGSSVGALNAAWLARNPKTDAGRLAHIWAGIRREDVFPASPMQLGLALLARRQYLVSPQGLLRLLEQSLGRPRIERLPVRLAIVTTDVNSGQKVVLTRGEAIPALMASCAIPGVFPPVRVGSRHLMDGGVADNTAMSVAADLGADVIYVLPSGYACALDRPPTTALGMVLHALTLVTHDRLVTEAESLGNHVELHIAPPLCPLNVSPADFAHSPELIDRAYLATRRWLKSRDQAADVDRVRLHPRHGASPHTALRTARTG
jgi:NTE family protein